MSAPLSPNSSLRMQSALLSLEDLRDDDPAILRRDHPRADRRAILQAAAPEGLTHATVMLSRPLSSNFCRFSAPRDNVQHVLFLSSNPNRREQGPKSASVAPILPDEFSYISLRNRHCEGFAIIRGDARDMHFIWIIHNRNYHAK